MASQFSVQDVQRQYEAMLAELPVAALVSPIQPEVYPEEVAVVVRNERDFATAVSRLLRDPIRSQSLKTKAKKFVEENFSKRKMIEKQIALFTGLLS